MPSPPRCITTLILVARHAIPLPGPHRGHSESEWLIEPFQAGETGTFVRHAETALRSLKESCGAAVLVFSGGATKEGRVREMGMGMGIEGIGRTEAGGYKDLVFANDLFGHDEEAAVDPSMSLRHRIFTEDYATDSFQNVLFSLLQFPIWVKKYHEYIASTTLRDTPSATEQQNERAKLSLALPQTLHIVSHDFKRSRFLDLHVPAVLSLFSSLPASIKPIDPADGNGMISGMKMLYTGIDPPFTAEKLAQVIEGDRLRGYGLWKDDVFGKGEKVRSKRVERGWDEKRREGCSF